MAFSDPRTRPDAERLKIRAKRMNDSFEGEIAEKVADDFLALTNKPAVGTGGELMPLGNNPPMGIVDTVKNPNSATAHASLERINLAENAGAYDLSFDMAETIQAKNSIEKSIAHQMAAAHTYAMKLFAEAGKNYPPGDRARLINAAAKMMDSFQGGALTLAKLRGGGQQKVTVVHQYVQVAGGGNVAVAGSVEQPNMPREGVTGERSKNVG